MDSNCATDLADPFLHPKQTKPPATLRLSLKSAAIVGYRPNDPVAVALQGKIHVACAGVSGGIGKGLLNHSIGACALCIR